MSAYATELLQLHDLHSAVADRPAQAPTRPDTHDMTSPEPIEATPPSSGIDMRAPIVTFALKCFGAETGWGRNKAEATLRGLS